MTDQEKEPAPPGRDEPRRPSPQPVPAHSPHRKHPHHAAGGAEAMNRMLDEAIGREAQRLHVDPRTGDPVPAAHVGTDEPIEATHSTGRVGRRSGTFLGGRRGTRGNEPRVTPWR